MKRVISLIISIAMIAGLAINCLAKGGGSLLSIETPDGKDHQWDTSDSNEKTGNGNVAGIVVTTSTNGFAINITSDVTIDKLKVDEASLEINIASGKKLTVSTTDDESNAIEIGKDLTITGGGTLETKYTSTYGIKATNNIIISNCNVTANGNGFGITAVENITITDSKVTSNSTAIQGCAIGAVSGVTIDGSIVTATSSGYYGIASTGDSGDIIIKNKSTVTASGNDAIYTDNDITIDGSIVTASGNHAIFAGRDVIIDDSTVTADAAGDNSLGILAQNTLNISTTDKEVKARGAACAFATSNENGIAVNGVPITDENVGEHFTGAAGYGDISGSGRVFAVTGTDFVTVKYSSDPEEDLDEEENDPEVELDLGNGPVTLKTSNNSVVFNDTKVFEVSIGDGDVFIPIDLSSAPKKIDGLFFNNEVYRYIDNADKDIKLINRFAYAEVYTNKEIGLNPLSLHLTDVSEIPGTCATAIQKKAMETKEVFAEVNYSFVTNGKPTDNSAKIYVPVPAEAKVFYLFDEGKIGIVPCEVKDGYCIFDRYFDGTYVVCATK